MPGSEVWVLTHPSTTPVAVGRAASLGTATQLARADHVHDGGIVEDVAIDDGDSPWTLVVTEEVIYVDSQAGSVTIALPAAVTGGHRSWTIVQIDGDAGTDITLDPFGGETINGVNANFDLPGSDDTGVRAWLLLCDGAAWWVV
ncbi:MAG TPA: hypothetical protein VFB99_21495, partial [Vicinamibacterales bacterium]|nr:hypothetical protein [Vicinamibacterales bacterium]